MTGQNRQERRWLLAVSLELKIIYFFKKGSRKLKEKIWIKHLYVLG